MNKEFTIGSHSVGNNAPVFIVAEMSANHLQDYGRAVEIIHAAKEAGADAVLAVNERGGRRRRIGLSRLQRTVGTQVHRNLGATQQIEHRQAIVRRLLDAHVTKARGDAHELHLGAQAAP